ncbi:hypothetical protein SKAU_G00267810 [Synaphobranchus kaupii]|uniref:WD repeat-containing protein 44 n=1 Tax=Synaphobranchus kaupii TaxID=118154 RepID=A0A9Q1EZP1_SYNKA|nr:hypothetical protein SKAU_G00267810 [Synaphobranchus kaupii]
MDSDTSGSEEFYDTTEDVSLILSTNASPAKSVLPSTKGSEESPTVVASSLAPQEPCNDDSLQIIDSIIEESQRRSTADELPLTEDVLEIKNGVPLVPGVMAVGQHATVDNLQEPAEVCIAIGQEDKGDCPKTRGPEKHFPLTARAPDITSTLIHNRQSPSCLQVSAEEEQERKAADILEQVSLAVFSGPTKPPRQFSTEPDIVASTKKTPPMRPPLPSGTPPPRPPPPLRPPPPTRARTEEVFQLSELEVSSKPVEPCGLMSPSTTVECITKELQHSLDLASATSGDKLVITLEHDSQSSGLTDTEAAGPQRPRSNSGRELTDEEILASVIIKNLDTGEEIPLSLAEEKLPNGINPLTLHIMRRTKEYITNDDAQSDDEDKSQSQLSETDGGKLKQRTTQLKKFFGKSVKRAKHFAEEYGEKAVNKVKSVRDEVFHTDQDDPSSSDDEGMPYTRPLRFKTSHSFKGPFDFDQIKVVQDLSGEHTGAVWTMKFSHCGRLLATAGQDNVVRIWVLKNAFDFFYNMRMRYNTEGRVSPSPSQESLCSSKSDADGGINNAPEDPDTEDRNAPFRQVPFCKYKGHTADLLDLSWSKNYFLLSSSMDKTVRLWHVSRRECLCCFQHIDFVTAIAFHPRDDRYFLSGSLDGKLRLWNIPDKKVALWNEVDGQTRLITAANFCQNGKYAVIGTYDGRCIFYDTEHLKYHTQIHVRSTRGRNRNGRKITGIEPLPGENKILVTSNDSRSVYTT